LLIIPIGLLLCARNYQGPVVQLVRIHACHAWGREFESRPDRDIQPFLSAYFVKTDKKELFFRLSQGRIKLLIETFEFPDKKEALKEIVTWGINTRQENNYPFSWKEENIDDDDSNSQALPPGLHSDLIRIDDFVGYMAKFFDDNDREIAERRIKGESIGNKRLIVNCPGNEFFYYFRCLDDIVKGALRIHLKELAKWCASQFLFKRKPNSKPEAVSSRSLENVTSNSRININARDKILQVVQGFIISK
jgi:hypothetical protein